MQCAYLRDGMLARDILKAVWVTLRSRGQLSGDVDRSDSTTDAHHGIVGQIPHRNAHRQDQSVGTLSKNEVSVCDDTAWVGEAHSL